MKNIRRMIIFAMIVMAIFTSSCSTEKTVIDDGQTEITSDKVSVSYDSESNMLSYAVEISKPTPCHEVDVTENIMESYPVQVQVSIDIKQPEGDQMCIQMIEMQTVEGEIELSEKPGSFSVDVDGQTIFMTNNIAEQNKETQDTGNKTSETPTMPPRDNLSGNDRADESICEDMCGDGTCQEIVCMGSGCPCAETAQNCPEDCS